MCSLPPIIQFHEDINYATNYNDDERLYIEIANWKNFSKGNICIVGSDAIASDDAKNLDSNQMELSDIIFMLFNNR